MQARTSALLVRLVDSLFALPVITIPEAQRLLGVTYRSAQRNVEKLVTAGILRPVGDASYGKTYLAAEILDIIVDKKNPTLQQNYTLGLKSIPLPLRTELSYTSYRSNLPPNLQSFASLLDAQPSEVQEAFQSLLATAMHEE